MASVLLTTVFKPFGIDDRYGRKENIPELLVAQVTRAQGIFTPRMWHSNAGLHLIAANCGVPTTVLEWPSLAEYEQELRNGDYDFVGINFIPCTYEKMRAMARVTRRVSPRSKIVLGGFGTIIPDLEQVVDVDFIGKGEGIRYMRHLLGLSPEFHFFHPTIKSRIIEFLGVPMFPTYVGEICSGLGCRHGCDFCLTSAYYECKYQPFLRSGREIYDLVQRQARVDALTDFWLIDENFLQDLDRAKELRATALADVENGRPYNLDMTWSSSDHVNAVDPEHLAEMGISSIWIGYESNQTTYAKNCGVAIPTLIANLTQYGINVLLSAVLFYDFHDEESLERDFQQFVQCGQAYSQFIPLTAWQTTPLFRKLEREGRMLDQIPMEERHGLTTSFHVHPRIPIHQQEHILLNAFRREYEINGPSLLRIFRHRLRGLRTFRSSRSKLLQKKVPFWEDRLKKHALFVVAMEDLIEEFHRDKVREAIEEARREFGSGFIDTLAPGAATLVRAAREGIERRRRSGEGETSLLQPEIRRTCYGPTA